MARLDEGAAGDVAPHFSPFTGHWPGKLAYARRWMNFVGAAMGILLAVDAGSAPAADKPKPKVEARRLRTETMEWEDRHAIADAPVRFFDGVLGGPLDPDAAPRR